MAITLTPDEQEITFFSFPIIKTETDEDGDLRVFGKCTDGSVDRDMERIDVGWSQSALKSWLDTGGNVRLQHDPKRPVGKGLKLDFSPDGHFLTALVVDRDAKELVKKGVLTAYSVGITRPDFIPDPTGKAVRVITGRKDGATEVAEVSLVDRPSNRNCGITLCKRAEDGTPEYIGKVFGSDDAIAKAFHGDSDTVNVNVPKSATITFSPSDLAKLLRHREEAEQREDEALKAAVNAVYKRDVSVAERRNLLSQGRALPGDPPSYPIKTHEDAGNAVTLALSGHGDADAAKALIRRIASKEGWQDILDRLDSKPGKPSGKPGKKAKSAEGLVASDYVFPETRSFPVTTPADVPAAVKAWDAYQGTRTSEDFRNLLTRLAVRKGDRFIAELPDEWKSRNQKKREQAAGATAAEGNAVTRQPDGPEVTKDADPDDGYDETGDRDLHHQDGGDDDTDSEADAMDKTAAGEKAAAPDMTKPPKAKCGNCGKKCKTTCKFCPGCGKPMTAEKADKPTPDGGAAGVAEQDIKPVPEHREPDGPAFEAFEHDAHLPAVPDSEAMQAKTASLHYQLGVPHDDGWLHDLTCPAFDPATAKAAHPLADLSMLDEAAWQAKALETAASAPLEQAREAAVLWQHARTVKTIPGDLADELRGEAHKAFRDANPGPGTAPVPGEIRAERYNRPYITDGHGAPSPGQDSPNKAPIHPGHISATGFQRDLITAGHASDSPGNQSSRPTPVPAPEVPGVPSRVYYTRLQRDNARQAMTAMHDHIARTFPDVCPMHGPGHAGQPGAGTRPVPAGVGGPVPHGASKAAEDTAPATADDNREALVAKAATLERKLRKARRAAGLEVEITGELVTLEPAAGFLADPDVIKTAVTDATSTLVDQFIAALAERDETSQAELRKLRKEIREVHKVADAIADQPDPGVTAYRGVALAGTPKTSAAPAGPPTVAQRAEHAQSTTFDAMHDIWRNHHDPEERLRALDFLTKMAGLDFEGKKAT